MAISNLCRVLLSVAFLSQTPTKVIVTECAADNELVAKAGLSFTYSPKRDCKSPNGKYRASCDTKFVSTRKGQGYREANFALQDIEKGEELIKAQWQTGAFFTVAFSADSRWAAVGGGNVFLGEKSWGEIRVWDTASSKLLFHVELAHDMVVESLAFSPDGATLVSGSQDGVVKWWDMQTHKELRRLAVHRHDDERRKGRVFHLAFTSSGKVLAIGAGCWNIRQNWGEVWLFDTMAQERFQVLLPKHFRPITSMEMIQSDTSCKLLVSTAAQEIKCWDIVESP